MSFKTGDNINAGNASWSFGGNVPKVFDEHVSKSVPFYDKGQDLICKVSDFFIKNNSTVYELGCSTGSLISKLQSRHIGKNGNFIGLDIERAMVDYAVENSSEDINFQCEDIVTYDYIAADYIVAYYTVQFIHPSLRQVLFDKIYKSLNWGGALLLFEKVRASDARFQDLATLIYTDYKLDQGYTPEEIIGKSRSLKGVLEPFSSNANIEMMKRAGFLDISTIFKYVCFEGFLAIK